MPVCASISNAAHTYAGFSDGTPPLACCDWMCERPRSLLSSCYLCAALGTLALQRRSALACNCESTDSSLSISIFNTPAKNWLRTSSNLAFNCGAARRPFPVALIIKSRRSRGSFLRETNPLAWSRSRNLVILPLSLPIALASLPAEVSPSSAQCRSTAASWAVIPNWPKQRSNAVCNRILVRKSRDIESSACHSRTPAYFRSDFRAEVRGFVRNPPCFPLSVVPAIVLAVRTSWVSRVSCSFQSI